MEYRPLIKGSGIWPARGCSSDSFGWLGLRNFGAHTAFHNRGATLIESNDRRSVRRSGLLVHCPVARWNHRRLLAGDIGRRYRTRRRDDATLSELFGRTN